MALDGRVGDVLCLLVVLAINSYRGFPEEVGLGFPEEESRVGAAA